MLWCGGGDDLIWGQKRGKRRRRLQGLSFRDSRVKHPTRSFSGGVHSASFALWFPAMMTWTDLVGYLWAIFERETVDPRDLTMEGIQPAVN